MKTQLARCLIATKTRTVVWDLDIANIAQVITFVALGYRGANVLAQSPIQHARVFLGIALNRETSHEKETRAVLQHVQCPLGNFCETR